MTSLTATLLSAPEDGVAPCFLLSLKPERAYLRPTEYLFNVPEGLSRLALEHRIRPSLGLRAAFTTGTNAQALGGLGSLLLRLKQDGHGSLALLGPSGTRATVEGVSQFVRWQHPQLQVTELQQRGPLAIGSGQGLEAQGTPASPNTAYEDDQMQVCCLWPSSVLWVPPSWLQSSGDHAPLTPASAPDDKSAPQAGEAEACGKDVAGAGQVETMAYSSGASSSSSSGGDSGDSGSDDGSGSGDGDAGEGAGQGAHGTRKASGTGAQKAEGPVGQSGEVRAGSVDVRKVATSSASSDGSDGSKSGMKCDGSSSSSSDSSDSDESACEAMVDQEPAAQPAAPPGSLFSRLDQFFAARQAGGPTQGTGGHAGPRHGESAPGRGLGRGKGGRGGRANAGRGRGRQPDDRAGVGRGGLGPSADKALRNQVLQMLQQGGSVNVPDAVGSQQAVHGTGASKLGKGDGVGAGAGASAHTMGNGGGVQLGGPLASPLPLRQHERQPGLDQPPQRPEQQQPQQQRHVLGYVCHVRCTGQLLLVLACPHLMHLPSLQNHPIVPAAHAAFKAGRLLATLHLTPVHVASTPQYRALMRKLPGPQVWAGRPVRVTRDQGPAQETAGGADGVPGSASGASTCAGHAAVAVASRPEGGVDGREVGQNAASPALPGTGHSSLPAATLSASAAGRISTGSSDTEPKPEGTGAPRGVGQADVSTGLGFLASAGEAGLGFLASARVAARLHLVSPVLFPLPHAMRQQQQRQQQQQQGQGRHDVGEAVGDQGTCRPAKGAAQSEQQPTKLRDQPLGPQAKGTGPVAGTKRKLCGDDVRAEAIPGEAGDAEGQGGRLAADGPLTAGPALRPVSKEASGTPMVPGDQHGGDQHGGDQHDGDGPGQVRAGVPEGAAAGGASRGAERPGQGSAGQGGGGGEGGSGGASRRLARQLPKTTGRVVEAGMLWRLHITLRQPGSSKADPAPRQAKGGAVPTTAVAGADASTERDGAKGAQGPAGAVAGGAGSAGLVAAAGVKQGGADVDVSGVPDPVCVAKVQQELLLSKGDGLVQSIQELHSSVPELKSYAAVTALLGCTPPAPPSAPLAPPRPQVHPGSAPPGGPAAARGALGGAGSLMFPSRQTHTPHAPHAPQGSWQGSGLAGPVYQNRTPPHPPGADYPTLGARAPAAPPVGWMAQDRRAPPPPGWLAASAQAVMHMQAHGCMEVHGCMQPPQLHGHSGVPRGQTPHQAHTQHPALAPGSNLPHTHPGHSHPQQPPPLPPPMGTAASRDCLAYPPGAGGLLHAPGTAHDPAAAPGSRQDGPADNRSAAKRLRMSLQSGTGAGASEGQAAGKAAGQQQHLQHQQQQGQHQQQQQQQRSEQPQPTAGSGAATSGGGLAHATSPINTATGHDIAPAPSQAPPQVAPSQIPSQAAPCGPSQAPSLTAPSASAPPISAGQQTPLDSYPAIKQPHLPTDQPAANQTAPSHTTQPQQSAGTATPSGARASATPEGADPGEGVPAGVSSSALLDRGLDEEPAPACLQGPEAAGTAVMFLGTGSAEPSKYRGPSAILLRVSDAFMLLDCGEGTWGQLLRWFGHAAAMAVVARLQCVWLSHKHADHVLGLAQILSNRPATAAPLLLVGPEEVGRWLEHTHAINPGWKVDFHRCSTFNSQLNRQPTSAHRSLACLTDTLGLSRWASVAVQHCRDAWGVVLEHRCGWKLVYSGDTRPCRRLEQAGLGATLLIHEATFEPGLIAMAKSKRHSTSAEALGAARGMQAYRTILTHFSQRYPRMPEGLDASAGCLRDRPAIAFDGMLVPFSLLPVLPLVVPVLTEVLLKEDEQQEQK